MSSTLDSARDDLAFMRALVQAGDDSQRPFGEAYLAAGICYGGQMLLHAGQALGWLPGKGGVALAIGLGPTVLFAALMVWIALRNRHARPSGLTARAINVVFQTVGLTNLALIAIIGSVALHEKSITIWLIYPCVVFALQGACWLAAFALRRRAWLGLVAAGWFVSSVAMAFSLWNTPVFIAIAGVALFAFMAAPGAAMIRLARQSA
jgi:hypothetical protein